MLLKAILESSRPIIVRQAKMHLGLCKQATCVQGVSCLDGFPKTASETLLINTKSQNLYYLDFADDGKITLDLKKNSHKSIKEPRKNLNQSNVWHV